MRVLLLGGQGMAGHVVTEYLRAAGHDVFATRRHGELGAGEMKADITCADDIHRLITSVSPEVVINTVGVLNQAAEVDVVRAIVVNSLVPRWLMELSHQHHFRIIHISTDCVFSGSRGLYREDDIPDGTSVYAKTKTLGEIVHPTHLTIRTSIIGPEQKHSGIGLFHWFMQQSRQVCGYTRAMWNGVTTLELAKCIRWSLESQIGGLVHLTGPQPISKFQLLEWLAEEFRPNDNVAILSDEYFVSDKTLVNTRRDMYVVQASYRMMMAELHEWIDDHRSWYDKFYRIGHRND